MRTYQRSATILVLEMLLILMGTVPPMEDATGKTCKNCQHVSGIASWYSKKDPYVKKYTASGEIFDDSKKTCASREYAFGVRLKVINLDNGKSVTCRVNDRGPIKKLHARVIDLSRFAFDKIADRKRGLVRVALVPQNNSMKNP